MLLRESDNECGQPLVANIADGLLGAEYAVEALRPLVRLGHEQARAQ